MRRQRPRRWFHRDNRRAFAICLLFGTIATLGVGTVIQQAPSGSIRIFGNGPGFGQTDDDLATGSIIFVPILGNTCRKRLIDNATWQIRDYGPVDCRAALARPSYPWLRMLLFQEKNGCWCRPLVNHILKCKDEPIIPLTVLKPPAGV